MRKIPINMKSLTFIALTLVYLSVLTVLLSFFSVSAVLANADANTNRNKVADFDGDGKADISVFRPSNGFWYIQKSTGGFASIQFGQSYDQALPDYDRALPADYDGDGKTDLAVYRRGPRNVLGYDYWYVLRSSDNALFTVRGSRSGGFGGDRPISADYDGDGKTDIASSYFNDTVPSPSGFTILQSSTNTGIYRQWGLNSDRLIPADYDGDGKVDLAVFRGKYDSIEAGIWFILQSSNDSVKIERFGFYTDIFVPADYDGDGRADVAVYRPSNGTWYRQNSRDNSFYAEQFGAAEDMPVPADYDGDGRIDIAVFRPSNGTWYLQQSKEGFAAHVFGLKDDLPVPYAQIPGYTWYPGNGRWYFR